MRRLLLLWATLACLEGCSCQEKPTSTSAPPPASTSADALLDAGPAVPIDAGPALSEPAPLPVPPETPPQPPPIPERAMQLHAQGSKQEEAGQLDAALKSFQEAREIAPAWPVPLYDIGLVYLLMKEDARALEAYEQLDALVPQGVSESKRMLDSLRRERAGHVPVGTLREFLEVERLTDPAAVRRRLEELTRKAPDFVPAWQALAMTADKTEDAERLLAKALSLEPDVDTRGHLLVFKATLLRRRHDFEAARKQLQALIDDPNTTPSVVNEARELLSVPDGAPP